MKGELIYCPNCGALAGQCSTSAEANRELFNALELAVATIKRLETVHPGGISSCTGTLDVCRKALEKGAPTP